MNLMNYEAYLTSMVKSELYLTDMISFWNLYQFKELTWPVWNLTSLEWWKLINSGLLTNSVDNILSSDVQSSLSFSVSLSLSLTLPLPYLTSMELTWPVWNLTKLVWRKLINSGLLTNEFNKLRSLPDQYGLSGTLLSWYDNFLKLLQDSILEHSVDNILSSDVQSSLSFSLFLSLSFSHSPSSLFDQYGAYLTSMEP